MTSRGEQTLGYAILGVFSLIALLPIAGILFTALQDPDGLATFGAFDGIHFDNFKGAWDEGNFGAYLKSSVIVTAVVVASRDVFSILVRLRLRADALPRLDGALLRVPARADGAHGGDHRAAVLRHPRPRADQHLLGR